MYVLPTCLLLEFFPILQFCIAIDWLCAGWLTLIYSIFTTSNWLQVHHPLPSILSRLLLTFTYFVMLFIAICLISFSLSLFSPFYSPFTPAFKSVCSCLSFSSCYFPTVLHHEPGFFGMVLVKLMLATVSFFTDTCLHHRQTLSSVLGLSSSPSAHALSSSQEETQGAGTEHRPWECRHLSPHLNDVQSQALPQRLLSCASHGAPDEPDERTGKS